MIKKQTLRATSSISPGRWALVTGASSGIGKALAAELAARGLNLVLVARRADRLEALASTLREAHGIDAHVVVADLTEPDAPDAVYRFTRENGIDIGVLVNNAGIMSYGEFWRSDLQDQLAMIRLNCQSVLHLTHLFAAGMVERRAGQILIVATTTLAPAPYVTTYAATKGFDLLFAEGLAEELAHHGITVSVLCPGPTQTEMGMGTDDATKIQSAQSVALRAVEGMVSGKRYIRPSFMACVMANLPRFLPRSTISGATEHHYRPESMLVAREH